MRRTLLLIAFPFLTLLLQGCASPASAKSIPQPASRLDLPLPRELEDRILALNPEHVTQQDIREVLSQAPAPRIVNIHGGIFPVYLVMKSFSRFLVGMGYPEVSIRNPGNGHYSFSCYTSSRKIADAIARYYEQEGLRPMLVGHSQGGMQAVKVLHKLANSSTQTNETWNPTKEMHEPRHTVSDLPTGKNPSPAGVQVCWAAAVGAGGLTRLLPNQWSMMTRLRKIPDSVEDFTGYYMGLDLLGSDLLGVRAANEYKPNGQARVRNVRLAAGWKHVTLPSTRHLLKSQQIKDWIDDYSPSSNEPVLTPKFDSDSSHILWAADVWYTVKKHWVLELQRAIHARRALDPVG